MEYKFKVGDTGKTRRGDDYRVICVDAKEPRSIIALICDGSAVVFCKRDGKSSLFPIDENDLLPPRQKRKVWVNVFEDGSICSGFETREKALGLVYIPEKTRIACVEVQIEFTPGEGL